MQSSSIRENMVRVLENARKAIENGELPIAASIVNKLTGEIVVESWTREKLAKRRLVHAEMLVLEAVDMMSPSKSEREQMVLFTNLEPCMMCLGACMVFGITQIYYSLESPLDGAQKLLPHYFSKEEYSQGYSVPDIQGGCMRAECISVFESYLNTQDPESGYYRWVNLLLKSI